MKNNTFGYTRYINDSPYLHKDDVIAKNQCGIRGFAVNENGSGIYKIQNDSLILTFNNPRSASQIDSIIVSVLPSEKISDSVNLTLEKHYNYKAAGGIDITATDENNTVVLFSVFEDFFSQTITPDRFPLRLKINYSEKLVLETAQHYKIDVYINCFRTYGIIPGTTKTYKLKSLIYDHE
ncbi:hypothetical protein ACI6PS_07275 [Flavobacterium sp. PLA-1-15]|uniref:hypothetical protein n=1 Tax=Flavobacterium sp. PLA-1-15 TaxID=3380533 RepID=UPI003B823343